MYNVSHKSTAFISQAMPVRRRAAFKLDANRRGWVPRGPRGVIYLTAPGFLVPAAKLAQTDGVGVPGLDQDPVCRG